MGEILIGLFILLATIPASGCILGENQKNRESVFSKNLEEQEEQDFRNKKIEEKFKNDWGIL